MRHWTMGAGPGDGEGEGEGRGWGGVGVGARTNVRRTRCFRAHLCAALNLVHSILTAILHLHCNHSQCCCNLKEGQYCQPARTM